jgi:4-hydroxy-2-oxoheptanedioate aldolase
VSRTVEETITRIRHAGKPAGMLATDPAVARRCIDLGTTFTAVGTDIGILARISERLAREFK